MDKRPFEITFHRKVYLPYNTQKAENEKHLKWCKVAFVHKMAVRPKPGCDNLLLDTD